MDARPVVGLTAMPKSSYRSRLPLHVTPLSHTPPKWTVGVAATCVNLLPAAVALRFWARYTDHAADAGSLSAAVVPSKYGVPYHTMFRKPPSQSTIHCMTAVADSS